MLFKQTFRRSFLAAILFCLSSLAFAQSPGTVGLGVKIGDPTGLSVKFYRPSAAIEVVAGRPYYFSGHYRNDGYYRDWFYKDKKHKYYRYHYYEASSPVALQVHFLKSKATKAAKELKWYLGAGPQFRTYRVNYYYYDDHNLYRHDRYTNIDLGLDGVFGLEYTFSDMPLSIFADVNLFLELVDEVNLGLQGGIGVRYNLK